MKALLLLFLVSTVSISHNIDNALGYDSRVNYPSLKEFGPWDDRNYNLTLEDLSWLSDNESELKEMVPAFYRVLFRKKYTDTPKFGKVQYPRSFYNYFKLRYDGYLIDGIIYDSVKWDKDRNFFEVIQTQGNKSGELIRKKVKRVNTNILINSGAESAIAFNPLNPNQVVSGVYLNGQQMLYSSDAGHTWLPSGDLLGTECCDPTVDWKSNGFFTYSATLGNSKVWFYRSQNKGQTWDSLRDTVRILSGPLANALNDKEYLHVDKSPTSPYKDNVYITWQQANKMQFAVSSTNGHIFTTQSFLDEPYGVGSDIVTDSNGAIYHFWSAYDNYEIRMNKSIDGGHYFTESIVVAPTTASFTFPIPSMDTRNVFIYPSADVDLTGGVYNNRIYVAWTDTSETESNNDPYQNHAQIKVAYSGDAGNTWNVSIPHETSDVLNVDRWHQWLKVDKFGVVHVTFYDTRAFGNRAGVDTYHSYSINGGINWSSPTRITQQSSPKSTGFEFGDYNGLDFASNGTGIAIFSDNRAENNPAPDMDIYAALITSENRIPDLIFEDDFE